MWKPEERGQLGRRNSRWQDNIKMDPEETGYKAPLKIHSLCPSLLLF